MNAYHITSKANYHRILADGVLRPRSEKRQFGEQGGGFSADWIAEDTQFVFFSTSDFYFNLQLDGADDTFGFVFDAEFLILGCDGIVGPDLLTQYDTLLHKCAQAVATKMGTKEIDEPSRTHRQRTPKSSRSVDDPSPNDEASLVMSPVIPAAPSAACQSLQTPLNQQRTA